MPAESGRGSQSLGMSESQRALEVPKKVKAKERPRTQFLGGGVHTDSLPSMVQVADEHQGGTWLDF